MRWRHHSARLVNVSEMALRWRWVRPLWIGCDDAGYGRAKPIWPHGFIAGEDRVDCFELRTLECNLGEFVEIYASQVIFLGRWCLSAILPNCGRTLLADNVRQCASFCRPL